jgi:hypothetical protein
MADRDLFARYTVTRGPRGELSLRPTGWRWPLLVGLSLFGAPLVFAIRALIAPDQLQPAGDPWAAVLYVTVVVALFVPAVFLVRHVVVCVQRRAVRPLERALAIAEDAGDRATGYRQASPPAVTARVGGEPPRLLEDARVAVNESAPYNVYIVFPDAAFDLGPAASPEGAGESAGELARLLGVREEPATAPDLFRAPDTLVLRKDGPFALFVVACAALLPLAFSGAPALVLALLFIRWTKLLEKGESARGAQEDALARMHASIRALERRRGVPPEEAIAYDYVDRVDRILDARRRAISDIVAKADVPLSADPHRRATQRRG